MVWVVDVVVVVIDFGLFWDFGNRKTDKQMNEQTNIGSSRFAFATEKSYFWINLVITTIQSMCRL